MCKDPEVAETDRKITDWDMLALVGVPPSNHTGRSCPMGKGL